MPNPVPDGYRTVTPFLVVNDGARMIEFLQAAFSAVVRHRMDAPDGTLAHAELKVGDSMIMMGQGSAEWPSMPCMIYLYVPDCDAVYHNALAAGGESLEAPTNQFYGDRNARVKDPSGNQWCIGTHVEDVEPDEMTRRMAAGR